MVKLYTENQLHDLPGNASKVCVVVVGGGWWWLESKLSDQLWLSFSLAFAKPNKNAVLPPQEKEACKSLNKVCQELTLVFTEYGKAGIELYSYMYSKFCSSSCLSTCAK